MNPTSAGGPASAPSPGSEPSATLQRVGGLPGTVGEIAWQLPTPIYPDTDLATVWRHLEETSCSLVPVMSRNGDYVGVVPRSELLRLGAARRPPRAREPLETADRSADPAASGAPLRGRSVRELLTRFPYAVDRRAPISSAKAALDEAAVGCVPVVDGVRLVGFVTSVEVLRAFFDLEAESDSR